MLGVNPHVQVRTHAERLTSANALELLAEYDLVLDGSDNFPTRYLVNDAGVLTGTPVVYGAILRWEGQVSLFATPEGPCYRCLFREPPPPGLVPDCAQAGVFGALPGVVGSMQAIEALKWVLGVGDSLAGRLLLFDALAASWREVRVRRNPECPVCGDEPTQTELIDYERFCGLTPESVVAAELAAEGAGGSDVSAETRADAVGQEPVDVSAETRARGVAAAAGAAADGAAGDATFPRTIDAEDLAALLEGDDPPLLVDVREEWEWEVGNLEPHGSVHMPLEQVPGRLDELPTERPVVMVCRVGSRSAQAALWLRETGHPAVANLRGGLVEWAAHVDSELTVA
jgi:adenylyltransferase/sulfurtransferase